MTEPNPIPRLAWQPIEPPFGLWLKDRLTELKWIWGLISIVVGLVAMSIGFESPPKILRDAIPALANLAAIAVLLVFLYRASKTIANAGAGQHYPILIRFVNCWRYVWIIWAALYIIVLVMEFVPQPKTASVGIFGVLKQLMWMLNMCHSVAIFALFRILYDPKKSESYVSWIVWGSVLSVLAYAAVLVLLFVEGGPIADKVARGCSFVTCLLSGFAMSSLAGRLESKPLQLPFWPIALMYLYAVLQPAFWNFDLGSTIDSGAAGMDTAVEHVKGASRSIDHIVFICALLLKVLLFMVVYWATFHGSLQQYFQEHGSQVEVPRTIRERAVSLRSPLTQPTHGNFFLSYVLEPDDAMIQKIFALSMRRLRHDQTFSEAHWLRIVREAKEAETDRLETTVERIVCVSGRSGLIAYMYFIYCARFRLVFVPYLVSEERSEKLGKHSVPSQLVGEALAFLTRLDAAKIGVVFEVEHAPREAEERTRCAARVRLFQSLAESHGLSLRIVDTYYEQPKLHDPEGTAPQGGVQLLLLYASFCDSPVNVDKGHLEFDEYCEVLGMVCDSAYGRIYRDTPTERVKVLADLALWKREMLNRSRGSRVPLRRSVAELVHA